MDGPERLAHIADSIEAGETLSGLARRLGISRTRVLQLAVKAIERFRPQFARAYVPPADASDRRFDLVYAYSRHSKATEAARS